MMLRAFQVVKMSTIAPQQHEHCQRNAENVDHQKCERQHHERLVLSLVARDGVILHEQRKSNTLNGLTLEHLKYLGRQTGKQKKHDHNNNLGRCFIDLLALFLFGAESSDEISGSNGNQTTHWKQHVEHEAIVESNRKLTARSGKQGQNVQIENAQRQRHLQKLTWPRHAVENIRESGKNLKYVVNV